MVADQKNLQKLREFLTESNSSNSNLDKIKVLEKYKDDEFIKNVLLYTYNTFWKYRLTVPNLIKNAGLVQKNSYGDDLFKLLDDLVSNISGHAALTAMNSFIADHSEYTKELYLIINRNLETRSTTTMINKVIVDLIPEFDVSLCESYDKLKDNKKPNFLKEKWYSSRKLDGVRCIAIVDANGDTMFYSRAGNEFTTLGVLAEEIKRLGFKNIVLDGEACLIKDDGADDFAGIMKEIKRKDHTIKNAKFKVFDILERSEFESKESDIDLLDRLGRFEDFVNDDSTIVVKLEQDLITSQEHFEELRKYAASMGWEGLIIRKDVGYEGKRSKNMLKVKNFIDAEYKVIRTVSDYIQVLNRATGLVEDVMMLSAVIIIHKGNEVSVGSGFTQEQRLAYHKDPSLIVGKTITVQYFEETLNQRGEYSLRFPTVKAIYDDATRNGELKVEEEEA